MRKWQTLFLRLALVGISLVIIVFSGFGIPGFVRNLVRMIPELAAWRYPLLIGMFLIIPPVLWAFVEAFRLLNFIDRGNAFSLSSSQALRNIKRCAAVAGGLCLLHMPIVYLIAELDDAPGLVILGGTAALLPIVIAVFAAVLQRLLEEAVAIKQENELTV